MKSNILVENWRAFLKEDVDFGDIEGVEIKDLDLGLNEEETIDMDETINLEETKELEVISCTREQQEKLTPAIINALGQYQDLCSWKGKKTGSGKWLKQFSRILAITENII